MSDIFDVIIIGAGAAGIGAGLAARAAGLNAVILEANGRIGGRAHAVDVGGVPYDLGCHYLHNASRNPFAAAALREGWRVRMDLHATSVPEMAYRGSHRLSDDERAACARFYEACDEAYLTADGDVAGASVIDTASPYYTHYTGWCEAIHGVPPERLSTGDYQRFADVPEDWPVRNGYGALIASFAKDLPIRLNCPVTAVDRTGALVSVETPKGAVRGLSVVVTVSAGVLASGAIRFTPELPATVQTGLDGVPMGYAERVCLTMDGPVFETPVQSVHVVPTQGPATGRMLSLSFTEFGDPTVGAYIAGDLAHDLTQDGGKEALVDATEAALAEVLGTDVLKRIVAREASCWSTDPLTLGGYSASLPGRTAARDALALRFDERVILAGEACALDYYATAHGAYFTGGAAIATLVKDGLGRGGSA